jgi:hypothetical protein
MATADMDGSRLAEMSEDLLVRAAGFFEGVGKHGEASRVEVAPGEQAVVIGGLGQADDDAVLPPQHGRGDGRHPAEGVAEDIMYEVAEP